MVPQPPRPRCQGTDGAHVVDVDQLQAVDDDDSASAHRCAACAGTSQWVALGRCGHRAVCPKCMVRHRFFERDKRCRICKQRCPKVVVTKATGATALPVLPSFSFRDGRAGRYWYHNHTAAYFEDEQEYQTARAACQGILAPFHEPLLFLISFMFIFVAIGLGLGQCVMWEMKTDFKSWGEKMNQRSLQITAFTLTISFALSVGTFFWYLIKRSVDPLEVEAFLADQRATSSYATF